MNNKLPKRKNIRLKGYDYSLEGYYFITICTKNRKGILGQIKPVGADDPVRPKQNIIEQKINLTSIGIMVEKYWKEINKIYDNVILDEYIIMPNHIHGIIGLTGGQSRPPLQKIIQGFKSVTTRECFKYGYKQIWQRNYYEHVIRNDKEYYEIKNYIQNNIINWEMDKYY